MNKSKKFLTMAFFIIAIISLIFAVSCFGLDTGYRELNQTYGGDAYTGIQNASAQAANNMAILSENINYISGMFFALVSVVSGLLGIYNSKQVKELKKKRQKKEKAQAAFATAQHNYVDMTAQVSDKADDVK